MKERLLNIFCGTCLVLCFIIIVSWARSSVASEGFSIGHRYSRYQLGASEGAFVFVHGQLVFESDEIEQAWRSAIDPEHSYDWNRWRFAWSRDQGMMGLPNGSTLGFGYDTAVAEAARRMMMPGIRWHRTIVQVPHWFVLVIFGIGPGVWWYRKHRVRKARVSKGLCRRCGFEMGEQYHSCPRCGERAPLPEGFPVIDPH